MKATIYVESQSHIVEEVRKVREAHAARFGYDLEAIYNDLKESEKRSGRKIVSLPPKKFGEHNVTLESESTL